MTKLLPLAVLAMLLVGCADDPLIKVRVISIQQPKTIGTCLMDKVSFNYGAVYEDMATGERFFSGHVLGTTGEVFIVRQSNVRW